MKLKRILVLLVIGLLMQQCAKQTAPTGGPKDATPPTLLRSDPKHKSINFKGDKVEFVFDELIQLSNPREQIIITPTVGKKFEATAKKNKVSLKFDTELQSNTTYTINFRESIQDLTEKNPAVVKMAFSTGTYLDSLYINGSVKEILTDKIGSNFTVALTPASDTFNIFKHPASWITLTNKSGKFSLENLKPGKYLLYAFDDKNKNLVVDTKSERYGFKSEVIELQANLDSVKISVVKQDVSKFKLLSSRPLFSYFNMRLSKSIVSYELASVDTSKKIHSILEPDLTNIKVFNTMPDLDSLQIRMHAQDSISNTIDTLIYIKFTKKGLTKDAFTYKTEFTNLYEDKALFSSIITFNKPVVSINTDSIYIQLDSITRISFSPADYTWNDNFTKLTLNKRLEMKPKPVEEKGLNHKKEEIKFSAAKGSLISVEQDSVTKINSTVKIVTIEDNGTIITKVQTTENFILQITDKNGKVIDQVMNVKNHSFEYVPPGNYSLRLLIDLNKNGKWDAGNYLTRQQPEPIVYYTNPKGGKETYLKANWQVGPLLISYP